MQASGVRFLVGPGTGSEVQEPCRQPKLEKTWLSGSAVEKKKRAQEFEVSRTRRLFSRRDGFQKLHHKLSALAARQLEKPEVGRSTNQQSARLPGTSSAVEIRMAGATTSQIMALHEMHARFGNKFCASASEIFQIIPFLENY
jgi:hypothetical protein